MKYLFALLSLYWWLVVPVAFWQNHCRHSAPYCTPTRSTAYLDAIAMPVLNGLIDTFPAGYDWDKEHYLLSPFVAVFAFFLSAFVFVWLISGWLWFVGVIPEER